jgi:hypothetical protein
MNGALRARKGEFEARRDLALMTAYWSGRLANSDWRQMPNWPDWLASMTKPKPRPSNTQIISFFRGLAANTKRKD